MKTSFVRGMVPTPEPGGFSSFEHRVVGRILSPRNRSAALKRVAVAMASWCAACPATATVTPYSWIRGGEAGSVFTDSSGTAHNFNAAFSSLGGGNPAVVLESRAVGGPLGATGATSTVSTHWGYYDLGNSGMWIQGPGNTVPGPDLWNLPAVDWVMEAWVLPEDDGASGGGTSSQFVSTGSGHFGGTAGGAAFRSEYNFDSTVTITAHSIGDGTVIGNPVVTVPGRWMHVAVVNNNGTTTFYANGVASGEPSLTVTPPSGVPYIGSGQDTGAPFKGWLDEVRYSTFSPGQFAVSDLLLLPPGPSIIAQPQSTTVWAGGTAPFSISIAQDPSATYQWRRGEVPIDGATGSRYILSPATMADNAAVFDVIVTSGGVSRTSSPATLTVVANIAPDVAAYRNAVQNESSLLAYFPADGDNGTTLTNTEDNTHNGTIGINAFLDGRRARAFGERTVSFNGDGNVQVPNNSAFEFSAGNGTVEALVYIDPAAALGAPTDGTIFAKANDGADSYYYLRASANGTNLIFGNSPTAQQSWVVPGGMTGKLTHVVVVIDGVNVTAYVNGESLGAKAHPGFGSAAGSPAWIGGMGTSATGNFLYGSVDELAIYGSALSQNSVQLHYSAYVFGASTFPPSFVSQSPSRTLLAGGSPVLTATVSGTLPITYQWYANNVPIGGATSSTLRLTNVTATTTYTLTARNAYGEKTGDPIVLTFQPAPSPYLIKVMEDAPTALWRLAETSGTTAVDSAGFNDGTYEGGFTLGVPAFSGETGTAVHFNGTTGRAIVPLSPVLNPNNAFSIELWGKLDHNNGNLVALSSLDRPSRGAGYEFYMGGNYPGWEFHTGGGGNYDAIVGDDVKQPVGEWYHIVGIFKESTIELYVNGQPGVGADNAANGNGAVDPPFTPNTVKPLYLGSRSDNANWWPGALSNVAFYNYALTAEQVLDHWTASTPLPVLNTPVYANGRVTLTWTGSGILQESDDFATWTNVPGNPVSGYNTEAVGRQFYRLAR